MIAVIDVPRISANTKLKQAYGQYLFTAAILAMTVHLLAALLSPGYVPRPYELREKPLIHFDIPDEHDPIPAPKPIPRPRLPEIPVPTEDIRDDVTIMPNVEPQWGRPPIFDKGHQTPSSIVAMQSPPAVIYQVAPVYPELARQAEAEGKVMIRVYIDKTGRVARAEVLWSEVIESLQQAAITAAYQWLFEPAKQRGVPVETHIDIPFVFTLH